MNRTFLRCLIAFVLFTGLVACETAIAQETAGPRTWVDASGRYSVEATFVRLDSGKVTLRKDDGSELRIPIEKLSDKDQALARSWSRRQGRRTDGGGGRGRVIEPAAESLDWPQWRGPNRDGASRETGLLTEWPEDGPELLWKVSGLGRGYSSVAISTGRIYTMGKSGNGTNLVALNESDGSQVWTSRVGGGSEPNCTPTVDGNLVFGLSFDGDLMCAETETGTVVWRKSFPDDFGGKMMSGWGYSESPLVDGNKLVCTPGAADAIMAALDKESGETIWKTRMPSAGSNGEDGAGYSSIVIGNGAGVRQYVQLVGRGVIGVDAESGDLLWGYNRIANGTANIPTPIVHENYVFCSSGYGTGSALLRLTGNRRAINAQEVYFKSGRELQNHHGGMVQVGKYVYMGHGHNNGFPACIDLSTGRIAWQEGRGEGTGSAAITYADGHLYFRYQDGTMALIEASPRRYRVKGSFKIAVNNGKSWPHPVIANGRLYLRDQNDLLCYDIRK